MRCCYENHLSKEFSGTRSSSRPQTSADFPHENETGLNKKNSSGTPYLKENDTEQNFNESINSDNPNEDNIIQDSNQSTNTNNTSN